MDKENEKKLGELACKLSSMTFVLHGCCINYEGESIDTADLSHFTEILHKTSEELFDLL